MSDHQPWEVLSSRMVYDGLPWLAIHKQSVRIQTGEVVDDFHRIQLPDYALVVAESPDGKILMERHYKHGVGRHNLTFPGGSIDPNEDPLSAAQRELLEETGYVAEEWRKLSEFTVHANYGCGKVTFFSARNARLVAKPNSGDLEEMQLLFLSREEILGCIKTGEIATIDTALLALMIAT